MQTWLDLQIDGIRVVRERTQSTNGTERDGKVAFRGAQPVVTGGSAITKGPVGLAIEIVAPCKDHHA